MARESQALLSVCALLHFVTHIAGVLGCPGSCSISPATVNVSEDQPGTVVCTIPNIAGSTAFFINQHREDIPNTDISPVATVTSNVLSSAVNFTYHLSISWTEDSKMRAQLGVIQCVANFHCPQPGGTTSPPCVTLSVNVNFVDRPTDPLTDNVNQTPGLSPTTGNVGEVINSEGLLAQNKGSKMSSNLTVILFSGLISVALLTRILIYGAR